MKKKDIKVGVEYLVCGDNDWTGPWARPTKMVAVDTTHKWQSNIGYYSHAKLITEAGFEVPQGTRTTTVGPHQSILMRDEKGHNVAIPLRNIRATWEDGERRVREAKEARDRASEERRSLGERNRATFDEALASIGTTIPAPYDDIRLSSDRHYPQVTMSLAAFDILARRAQQ